MPNVRTVNHQRDIVFIDTTEDGHRVTIAKGVTDGKYHGLQASGRNKQAAFDNLLELKAELDKVAVEYGVTDVEEVEGWQEIAAFQAQPVVQERERRCREVLDRIDSKIPEYCPGPEDPRCRAACTTILEDGRYKIYDPDCFR